MGMTEDVREHWQHSEEEGWRSPTTRDVLELPDDVRAYFCTGAAEYLWHIDMATKRKRGWDGT